MESSDNIYECIVVGAGPGGIVATKELLENGFDNVLCLEQSGGIGGVFAKGYDNLELTSSAARGIRMASKPVAKMKLLQ